jgi:hypothetical protein
MANRGDLEGKTLHYSRAGVVAARTPLLAASVICGLFEQPDIIAALRYYLQQHATVRHAIRVSSKSLGAAMDSWLEGQSPKSETLPLRLLAYISRMSSRATPFGLCAGIGMVDVGESTTLRIDDGSFRTCTRPDMELLASFVALLERGQSKRLVRYCANRAIVERGGRLYVTNVRLAAPGVTTEQRPVTLRNTAAAAFLRSIAQSPTTFGDLATQLAVRFEATYAEAERLLETMIDAGVIISELILPPLDDPARRLAQRASEIDLERGAALTSALESAAALDERPLNARSGEDYTAMLEAFVALVEKAPANVVQIDMSARFNGTLGKRILDDAAELGEYLARMGRVTVLDKFRERFIERYEGTERMVPLLELVDDNIGLGSPDAIEFRKVNTSERDAVLLQLARDANAARALEVVLTQEQLSKIVPELNPATAPRSLEVGFQVAAASQERLEAGDYKVVPSAFIGSTNAGSSLGRFLHLFESRHREHLRSLYEVGEPNGIAAEVVFVPPSPRLYNVTIRPRLHDAEIRIGVNEDADGDYIRLDDLWVGLEAGLFFLWSASRSQRVFPRETHVLNANAVPNVCRFLSYLERDGKQSLTGFDWGAASTLPVLPRLRYGRIVLSHARWRMFRHEFPDESTAGASLDRSRSAWGMPRFVRLLDGDNSLLLDLDSSIAPALVLSQLAKSPNVDIIEAYPSPDDLWVEGGDGKHVVEFVAQLVSKKAPEPVKNRAPLLMPKRRRFEPGSEWLYAKLYVGAQALEDVLLRSVVPVIEELRSECRIDRWFFVRYVDTMPHLRVRIHAEDGKALLQRFAAHASRWVEDERISRFAFDTYDPEYERYGGAENIAAAEGFFSHDSERCVHILKTLPPASDGRVEAAVQSFLPWLLDNNELLQLALDAFDGKGRKLLAQDRDALKRVLAAVRGGEDAGLADALIGEHRDDRLRSLFHMHCNRLGVHGSPEWRSVILLRAAALSSRSRTLPEKSLKD